MSSKNNKKPIIVIGITLLLVGALYYNYTNEDIELLEKKNWVKIDYQLSITMANESNGPCTFYLPGYQNREGDFLDINNDMVLEGSNATLNPVETIHGPALEVVANGSFSISLDKTYENKIFINDTSVGFQDFWGPTLYEVDEITFFGNYFIGHLWIYYNGSGCQNNVTLSINEFAHFRYHYSTFFYYTLNITAAVEPVGWNYIRADRSF